MGKPWIPHQQIENQHPGSPQSSKSKSSLANHPKVHQDSGEGQSRLQCRAWPSSDARETQGGDVGRNKWPHLAAQFPSLPAGISCLLEQGTKCWMLSCLPPANRICEQPVGPALQHHPAQWVFWVWEDPKLALSLPHPQLHVQGHGNLPSATPELPAEGFGNGLSLSLGKCRGFNCRGQYPTTTVGSWERGPLELFGERRTSVRA